MSEDAYKAVATLDALPSGKSLVVEIDEHELLLCHTPEGIFAIDNLCTHAAERLSGGKLKGFRIFCPLHGASFDVRDGCALTRPASVALKTYPVRCVEEEIQVQWLPQASST